MKTGSLLIKFPFFSSHEIKKTLDREKIITKLIFFIKHRYELKKYN